MPGRRATSERERERARGYFSRMRESGVWGAGLERELQGSVSLGTTDQLNLTPRLGSEPQFPKHLSPRYCRRMNRPRKFWEFVLISIRHGNLQRRLRQAKHGNIALLEPLNPKAINNSIPYRLKWSRQCRMKVHAHVTG